MSKHYNDEFKASMIEKMLSPNETPVSVLSKETGVSEATLYKWRLDYQTQGHTVPQKRINTRHWSSANKLAAVIESAAYNEAELGEYCRCKGLYKEQIKEWKLAALSGYERTEQLDKIKQKSRQSDLKKINALKQDLARKEKALAETAALLVLSKKWEAIWGENAVN